MIDERYKEYKIPTADYAMLMATLQSELPPTAMKNTLDLFWEELAERLNFDLSTITASERGFRYFIARKGKNANTNE